MEIRLAQFVHRCTPTFWPHIIEKLTQADRKKQGKSSKYTTWNANIFPNNVGLSRPDSSRLQWSMQLHLVSNRGFWQGCMRTRSLVHRSTQGMKHLLFSGVTKSSRLQRPSVLKVVKAANNRGHLDKCSDSRRSQATLHTELIPGDQAIENILQQISMVQGGRGALSLVVDHGA
jgi:hypothetical protein